MPNESPGPNPNSGIARNFIPPVSYSTFLVSAIAAFLAMVVLTIPPFTSFNVPASGDHLDKITYFLDPLLCNVVGIFLSAVIIYTGTSHINCSISHRFIFSASLPLVTVILGYVVTHFALKPSFGYDIPTPKLSHPILFEFFKGKDALRNSTSTPSGSVFCQFLLFFVGLVYFRPLRHRKYRTDNPNSRPFEWACMCALLGLGLLVGWLRYHRGYHSVFDAGIALGVSSYAFWFSFYVISRIAKRSHPESSTGLASLSLLNIPVFLYFSRDAHWWIAMAIAVLWALGAVKLFTPPHVKAGID